MKNKLLSGLKGSLILGTGLLIGNISSTKEGGSTEIYPELTLPAIVTDIHDGDTLSCKFTINANIRMLDNWSKELSKEGGNEAKNNMLKNCPVGSQVIIKIPIYENISKSFTFGRVLGKVYKDGVDLSELQVKEGFATPKKVK